MQWVTAAYGLLPSASPDSQPSSRVTSATAAAGRPDGIKPSLTCTVSACAADMPNRLSRRSMPEFSRSM